MSSARRRLARPAAAEASCSCRRYSCWAGSSLFMAFLRGLDDLWNTSRGRPTAGGQRSGTEEEPRRCRG